MPDTYDRLEAAIQDWIREQGDDTLVLTDWYIATTGIHLSTAADRVEYYVGGSGARTPCSASPISRCGTPRTASRGKTSDVRVSPLRRPVHGRDLGSLVRG